MEKLSKFTKISYYIFVIVIGVLTIGCIGCESIYTGTTETGLAHFPKNNKISVEKAVELANPYLDESYKLRQSRRSGNYPPNLPTSTYVILKGNFYYITKDYWHHKAADFYLHNSVKVNKDTGETEIDRKTN